MNCATGACPVPDEPKGVIKLADGAGGREMHELIKEIGARLRTSGWQGSDDDAASFCVKEGRVFFTTDSYVVTPLFFPGGNIGKLAFCGTVNDLAVKGALPIGLSLSLVIEEGLPKDEFFKIIQTIGELSKKHKIPIVTGDTKVMDKGAVDKLVICTSGVGTGELIDSKVEEGDVIVVSGGIGEHGAALLAKRFELETELETDSKVMLEEVAAIQAYARHIKDITRGGLASVLCEIAEKKGVMLEVEEEAIPAKKEVKALCGMLGIDFMNLACEGRLVAICKPDFDISALKKLNPAAAIIGKVSKGSGVVVQTRLGKKMLHMPSGNIVPRIC
ncbi:MAG: hydrogenase expression/formation protein HypE [Nanoarchaeota archaeon]|nr:hydrogenase expression/formation protein HypE [Nanoarchaeota archaeon]